MPRPLRAALTVAGLALATVADYLAWLGWDQHKDLHPDGSLSGPYAAWQVVGLTLVLLGMAIWAGRRDHVVLAYTVIPLALTLCFAIDSATDRENDGLWPIGAALVLVGSAIGVGLCAFWASGSARRGAD